VPSQVLPDNRVEELREADRESRFEVYTKCPDVSLSSVVALFCK
jgi:hypothetical protein